MNTASPVHSAWDPLFDVSGKVALITGASSGIGLHLCELFASRGAHVIAASRAASKSTALAELAAKPGSSVATIDIDVASSAAVERGIAEAGAVHGRFDIVINNAGSAQPQRIAEMTEPALRTTIDTNLIGPFLVTHAAIKFMGAGASVVQIASVGAFKAVAQLSAYAASKAGLVMMARTVALELAEQGIRVNTIVPGYVRTNMNEDFLEGPDGQKILKKIPARRFGTPQDIGGAALFLCSEASAYVTGGCFVVDGGFLL